MDDLPTEILRMICVELDTEDVPAFRLLGRCQAAVGMEYLFPEGQVDFYLCERDASHLQQIAQHPELKHLVRTLHYEAHTLHASRKSYTDWKQEVSDDFDVFAKFKIPCFKSQPRTETEWKQHYSVYTNQMRWQSRTLRSSEDVAVLREVFAQCPNLNALSFSNGFEYHNHLRKHHPFEDSLIKPFRHLEPSGIRQLFGALDAAVSAKVKLDKLVAGTVSWEFFIHLESIPITHVRDIFSALTTLRLSIATGAESDDPFTEEPFECYQELRESGCVGIFLAGIPNLRVLALTFDSMARYEREEFLAGALLSNLNDMILEGHVWPGLQELELCGFEACEQDLKDFLLNHQASLQSLVLMDAELTNESAEVAPDHDASWFRLLSEIRNSLDLQSGYVAGQIRADGVFGGRYEDWEIDTDDEEWQDAFGRYLRRINDECPLTRLDMNF